MLQSKIIEPNERLRGRQFLHNYSPFLNNWAAVGVDLLISNFFFSSCCNIEKLNSCILMYNLLLTKKRTNVTIIWLNTRLDLDWKKWESFYLGKNFKLVYFLEMDKCLSLFFLTWGLELQDLEFVSVEVRNLGSHC